MKIGIEARKLFSVNKHGMDLVALELIRNIPIVDPNNHYVVFAMSGSDRVHLPDVPNLEVVELPVAPVPGWEQFILPFAASKHGCDLLHCTSNTAPMRLSMPLVLTLHDIVYLENIRAIKDASSIYQKMKNHYRKFVVPRIVEHAAKVITVSKFQEKIICTHLSLPSRKIVTINNGVSNHFKDSCDMQIASQLKEKYHLPQQFILFLGNDDPKKNTPGVLLAYKQFLENSGLDTPLVVADVKEKKLMRWLSEINAPELREKIILTGYINNETMPYLYSLASLFLYPSIKESFGIPILEAMSCGTPVITSNTSSMPEVAGTAAFIVDPFDTLSIAKAMGQILQHDILRDSLIKKGREQALKFSFIKMAEEVHGIYESVFAGTEQ